MNILCKLFGHKTITKGYGNKYGSGKRIACTRCGDIVRNFERRQHEISMQVGDSQVVRVEASPI